MMPITRKVRTAGGLLLGWLLLAPTQAQTFPVQEFTLDNGLKVLLIEDHAIPIVTYYTFYRVGSKNERPGITGISHLFEHMMFNGAKKYGPKEFDRVLERNGGYSNAYTSTDVTAYYEVFPPDKLEIILDLERDRMTALALSEQMLASERNVVKEERRLRTDNSVEGTMWELLEATVFLAHPYHWPVVGWMGDLTNITLGDCQDYFKTYYAPNNATLILAGDFDPKTARALIRRYLGDIPAQEPPIPVAQSEPEQIGERRVQVHKAAQLAAYMAAWPAPPLGQAAPPEEGREPARPGLHPDAPVFDVLQTLLASGESSRLYQRLVYQDEIATIVQAYFDWREHPSLFMVYCQMKPGHATGAGEAAVYEELDRLAAAPVSERELQKAINQLEADLVRTLQTSDGKANQVGTFDVLTGDYRNLFQVLDAYRRVTPADVQRVVQQYFRPTRRTVVTLVPEAPPEAREAGAAGQAKADRTG